MEINPNLSEKGKYDFELIQKAINNGDQQAYAELMMRYRDSVYFTLLKMVKNNDDADDLTIEAFGKAFKMLHNYKPTYAFSTWLFRIATNNCIDFLRKQKKNYTISLDQGFDDSESNMPPMEVEAKQLSPEQKMIQQQNINIMRELVKQLKPKYRELVEMRYFQELSYLEIAEQKQLPLGTVKAQLFRSRELLYHIIKKAYGKSI
jgi:RNA polymerase sigma factor (sigma-70 family)